MSTLERYKALNAAPEALEYSAVANLRWLAENPASGRVPCGMLTGAFIYQVADLLERLSADYADRTFGAQLTPGRER